MSTINDGGPAFPSGDNDSSVAAFNPGMTLRDYFAGQALAGLLASGHFTYPAAEGAEDEPGTIRVRAPQLDDNGEETGKKKTYFPVIEEAVFLAGRMVAELQQAEDR